MTAGRRWLLSVAVAAAVTALAVALVQAEVVAASRAVLIGSLVLFGAVAVGTNGWRRLVEFAHHKEPGLALALFRIAVGGCVLVSVGDVVYGDLWHVIWVDSAYGGIRDLQGTWLVNWLGGPTPAVVSRLSVAALLSGALMVLGLGGRLTPLFTLFIYNGLVDLNGDAGGSYDELLSNALWILVLANSTATLSVDCRLRNGSWVTAQPVAAWPRYLAILQIVLCYWTTGLQKLSAYWAPGGDFSALYYILQQPSWVRYEDMTWVAWLFPLTQLGTAVTWLWEVSAVLVLLAFWYRATRDRKGRMRAFFNAIDYRLWFVTVGLTFHLLIFGLMNVGPFSPVSIAYYFCLWHPDEWRDVFRRLQPRRGAVTPR